jgi:hypothetical protein
LAIATMMNPIAMSWYVFKRIFTVKPYLSHHIVVCAHLRRLIRAGTNPRLLTQFSRISNANFNPADAPPGHGPKTRVVEKQVAETMTAQTIQPEPRVSTYWDDLDPT